MLFNIYLEEALLSRHTLKRIIEQGRLKSFADDIAIVTDSLEELNQIIDDLGGLEGGFNLRLNKKKSVILTLEKDPHYIKGFACATKSKNLGVDIALDI